MITLREYQNRGQEAYFEQVRRGCRSVVIVSPTGSGKTTIGVDTCLKVANGGKVLWIAHRTELIDQAVLAFKAVGVNVGVVGRNDDNASHVCIASVQTLLARGDGPDAVVVVADECHHYVAEQWRCVIDAYPNAKLIGLTATPERGDGAPLDIFDSIVVVAQTQELIDLGHLCDCRVLAPTSRSNKLADTALAAYERFCKGEKFALFPASSSGASKLALCFTMAGYPTCHIRGGMNPNSRMDMVTGFRTGKYKGITGVHTITEGFDVPDISCIILARGFSSHGSYLQACGRALRPTKGKTIATIIDLCGVSNDFGLPTDDRVFSLTGKPIRSVGSQLAISQCLQCGRVWRASEFVDSQCPACGWLRKGRQDPAVKKREIQEACSKHDWFRKNQEFQKLMQIQAERGYKRGWAAVQFKIRYGHFPGK